jgi:tetratricopeptide (TPR) repeat protein
MTPFYLVHGIGLLYVLAFAGLSRLRRERFSLQFAAESLCVTYAVYAAVRWGRASLHPVYFLVLLYFLTMRVRLLVEAGNLLSGWERYRQALGVYRLALRLFPDKTSRLITIINIAATWLKLKEPGKAVEALEPEREGIRRRLGPKYRAGSAYNLGMAYRRCGRFDEALRAFREAEDAFPLSKYALLAGKAVEETRKEAGLTPPAPGERRIFP